MSTSVDLPFGPMAPGRKTGQWIKTCDPERVPPS